MVTTDYQVVQGGIFHIRDVTLFQWGNTCSARYKLHERAYTGRHVCCLRILRSLPISVLLAPTLRCIRTGTTRVKHTGLEPRRHGTGSRRGVQVLSLSLYLLLLRPSSSRSRRGLPFSQNHSHVRQSAYKSGRPLFRETDPLTDHRRHRTPARYPLSRLEPGLLTGGTASLASPVTAGISKPLDRKDEIAGEIRRDRGSFENGKGAAEIATRTGPRPLFVLFFGILAFAPIIG